ncbi:MAG: hypothetical protein WBL23_01065 [Salinisphaera sp.]
MSRQAQTPPFHHVAQLMTARAHPVNFLASSNMSQQLSSDHKPSEDRLNSVVFYGSAVAIVLFSLWTMIFTDQAQSVISAVKSWISATFGW